MSVILRCSLCERWQASNTIASLLLSMSIFFTILMNKIVCDIIMTFYMNCFKIVQYHCTIESYFNLSIFGMLIIFVKILILKSQSYNSFGVISNEYCVKLVHLSLALICKISMLSIIDFLFHYTNNINF